MISTPSYRGAGCGATLQGVVIPLDYGVKWHGSVVMAGIGGGDISLMTLVGMC